MESKMNLIPIGLLSVFTAKLIFLGTNVSEMGAVFALSGVAVAYEYFSKSRRIQKVEQENLKFETALNKKVEDQVQIISKQNDVIKAMATEIAEMKSNMSAIKMANGIRKVGT